MTVSCTMIFCHLGISPFDAILSQFHLIKIIETCCSSQIRFKCCYFVSTADPSGRVVESRRGHGCLSLVSVVGVYRGFCDGPSLVQRSPTECGVSVYDLKTSTTITPRPIRGCWAMTTIICNVCTTCLPRSHFVTRILVSCIRTEKMGSVRVTLNVTRSCNHCCNWKQQRLCFVSLLAYMVAIDSTKPVVFFHRKAIMLSTVQNPLCFSIEKQ